MFDTFAAAFRPLPVGQAPSSTWRDDRLLSAAGYTEFAGRYAGVSFENGLYRLHDETTGPQGE
jgi:hypothetical protein